MTIQFRLSQKLKLTGWAVRLFAAPFLLQWFHPDERQTLEFAHRLAHPVDLGSPLQAFLESDLHLRNQTLPALFALLIRGLDALAFSSPHAYLTVLYWILGGLSWLSLTKLTETVASLWPKRLPAVHAQFLGWVFALFWPFVVLYPRALLESVSFTAAAFGFCALVLSQFFTAGFFLGLSGTLRYPSILFLVGGALYYFSQHKPRRRDLILGTSGVALAVFAMGIADWVVYNRFFESAFKYWQYNRPGGPVEAHFGKDDLYVYLKWFETTATPWLAPLILGTSLWALVRCRELLIFTLPYIIGHLWSAHREPRFMLPLMPFTFLAIALQWQTLIAGIKKVLPPRGFLVLKKIALLHLFIGVVWIPLYLWAQTQTGAAAILLNHAALAAQPTLLINLADPIVDALLPATTTLQGSDQTILKSGTVSPTRTWILSSEPVAGASPVFSHNWGGLPTVSRPHLERLFRVHLAQFYFRP